LESHEYSLHKKIKNRKNNWSGKYIVVQKSVHDKTILFLKIDVYIFFRKEISNTSQSEFENRKRGVYFGVSNEENNQKRKKVMIQTNKEVILVDYYITRRDDSTFVALDPFFDKFQEIKGYNHNHRENKNHELYFGYNDYKNYLCRKKI